MTKEDILEKRAMLIDDVRKEYEKLFIYLENTNITNNCNGIYNARIGSIREKLDKIVKFNSVICEFFDNEFRRKQDDNR